MKPSAYLVLAGALGGLALASFASSYETVAIFSAVGAFVAFVRWKRTAGPAKERSERHQRNAELRDLIPRRFPSDVFWPAPEIMERMQSYGLASSYFSEEPERWRQIVERYPLEPRDDEDRLKGEALFWAHYARIFCKNNTEGQNVLSPKHIVMQYVKDNEKWILREYCAATGEIKDPIIKSHSAVFYDLLVKESKGYASTYYYELATKEEYSALKQFDREIIPDHYKTMGEWFFFGIERSFRQIQRQATGLGDRSASDPASLSGDPTDDDEMSYPPTR